MQDNENKNAAVEQKKESGKKDNSMAAAPAFINAFTFMLIGISRLAGGMDGGAFFMGGSVLMVLMGIALTLGLRKTDKKNKDK